MRRDAAPKADNCEPCPGSSEFGYSLQPAKWDGNETRTGLAEFCHPCPQPATSVFCGSQTEVIPLPGWWMVQQEDEDGVDAEGTRRSDLSRDPDTTYIMKTYKCDPNVCLGGNKCANNRSGVACGSCPDNHVLQVGVCTPCGKQDPNTILLWRVTFCVAGSFIIGVAWFILCWAPVFGKTSQDYIEAWFGWPIRLFQKLQSASKNAKKLMQSKKKIQNFFKNPKNVKLAQVGVVTSERTRLECRMDDSY